jgi:hypothetical protein
MKRSILLLLSAVVVMAVSAQGLKLGIKAGANLNKVDGQSFNSGYKLGYQLGGFLEVKLNKKWSVQPEVLFNQSNTTPSVNFGDIYHNIAETGYLRNVKLNYLSIPLLLNYKLTPGIALQAGPQYSILLDQSKTLLANGAAAFKNGDFAMVGGLQVKISSFRVFGRYQVGLNNINDIDNRDRWKNQAIQVGVGIGL